MISERPNNKGCITAKRSQQLQHWLNKPVYRKQATPRKTRALAMALMLGRLAAHQVAKEMCSAMTLPTYLHPSALNNHMNPA